MQEGEFYCIYTVKYNFMKKNTEKKEYISPQEISLLCQQILLILKSDIPLEDGLLALCEDAENVQGKSILDKIYNGLKDFKPLYQAFDECGVFPPYMVGMLEIGEKSGKLENTVSELAAFYEREDKLNRSVMGAVAYPLFLITMMTIVLTVLVWKILPIFRQIINGFGENTASATAGIMNVGEKLGIFSLVLAVLLLVVTACIYISVKTGRGGFASNKILNSIPIMKKVSFKMSLSRFASVMYTMFESGYRAEDALHMVKNIIEDDTVNKKIEICRQKVDSGESLLDSLIDTKLFVGVYARMIGIGFRTGGIDTVMKKLSEIYGEEARNSIDNMVAVIEPVLVGVLSVLIGIVLISVMLPLIGAMAAI